MTLGWPLPWNYIFCLWNFWSNIKKSEASLASIVQKKDHSLILTSWSRFMFLVLPVFLYKFLTVKFFIMQIMLGWQEPNWIHLYFGKQTSSPKWRHSLTQCNQNESFFLPSLTYFVNLVFVLFLEKLQL